MKIIFLGTPLLALGTFNAIYEKYGVVAVVTQEDKSQKRSKKLIPSVIASRAEELGVDVLKPSKIDSELCDKLKSYNADIFVTFAYGKILTKEFLGITKFGGINIHPSMLPKYRGASPIQSAVLNGETSSGITVQKVAYKVDSGDILYQKPFNILEKDDVLTLEEKIEKYAAEVILKVLEQIDSNGMNAVPQNEDEATYCRLFKKEDGKINWNLISSDILNKVRAFVKWPGAFTFVDDKKLTIYKVEPYSDLTEYAGVAPGTVVLAHIKKGILIKTGDGLLSVKNLQIQGKKAMDYKSFLNGHKDFEGLILK